MPKPSFNRDAFNAILQRSDFETPADFAREVGISPGALHDISALQSTGKPRRTPSMSMIRKLASGLKVPITALINDPNAAEAESAVAS